MLPTLNNHEAAGLVRLVLDRLEGLDAQDVISGIEESRRLGIEESVDDPSEREQAWSKGELRQLGTVRRRPPTDVEMLRLVLERLHERLIIVPALARALRSELKTDKIVWRVDSEFVSTDRSPSLEATIGDLLPDGTDEVAAVYERIREMLPELAPGRFNRG